jgi:superfamily II DNA or RNA helicase
MRFNELLARADDELLQDLVGPPTVRLLNLLDPNLSRPTRLRELVTSFKPPEELLRDVDARTALLDLLPRQAAESLADQIGIETRDPYESFHNLRVTKGSATERRLFSALGVVPMELDEPEGAPAISEAIAGYSLFTHQRLAARRAQDILNTAPNRVLLHMPTGSGKTRTAMHLVSRELLRAEPSLVVWLAYSEELCEQAASEFQTAWDHLGDRTVKIYRFWGARQLDISAVSDGFLVAGLAKTYQRAQRDADFLLRLSDRANLVVIDEAHQAIAESYRFLLDVLVGRRDDSRLLGLSATPGRTWDEPDKDRELATYFRSHKVTLAIEGYDSPVNYLVDEGYLARATFESLPYEPSEPISDSMLASLAASLDVPESLLAKLADDEQRNLLILNSTEKLTERHERILLFAATVSHARLLATVLRARGIQADSITALTPTSERMRLISKYKSSSPGPMVLCNYGVLTTGFDAPRTSAAVIARPTKSLILYSQMAGRAMRGPKAGGNKEARILTVVDTSLPGFGNISDAFQNWEDVW